MWQCLVAPALFNLGGEHRARWRKNKYVIALFSVLLIIAVYVILADPNAISCSMRVNCGNADKLLQLGYEVPLTTFGRFEGAVGHNVMPVQFRWALLGFVLCNALVNWAVQELIISPFVRQRLRRMYPSKKRIFSL